MNDWHHSSEMARPEWLDAFAVIFITGGSSVFAPTYGPIEARMVDWSTVSAFRLASQETTYR